MRGHTAQSPRWFGTALLVLMFALVGAACGGAEEPPGSRPSATVPASPADTSLTGGEGRAVQGTWDGKWSSTSDPGFGGEAHIVFTQNGNDLAGEIDVGIRRASPTARSPERCPGTRSSFGAVQAEQSVSYTGTLSGSTISGTYSAPDCGNGAGTWQVTKIG